MMDKLTDEELEGIRRISANVNLSEDELKQQLTAAKNVKAQEWLRDREKAALRSKEAEEKSKRTVSIGDGSGGSLSFYKKDNADETIKVSWAAWSGTSSCSKDATLSEAERTALIALLSGDSERNE